METDNGFLHRLLGRGDAAQTQRVGARLQLLDELERLEVEDEDLVLEDDDEHVLAEADVLDFLVVVERDFGAVLLLVVVPNHHLVLGLGHHQHDDVRLVHHLHQLHRLVQQLALLLDAVGRRVVLDDFEPNVCSDGEVFLRLVAGNVVNAGFIGEVEASPDVGAVNLSLVRFLNLATQIK